MFSIPYNILNPYYFLTEFGNASGNNPRRRPSSRRQPIRLEDLVATELPFQFNGHNLIADKNAFGEFIDVRLLPHNVRPRIGDPTSDRSILFDLGWIKMFMYIRGNNLVGTALAVEQPDGTFAPKLFPR